MIESTYSCSSLVGLVSSNRRLHLPSYSAAKPEVQADAFGVPNVQVAVGLGRKSRVDDLFGVRRAIGVDDLLNEITRRAGGGVGGRLGGHLGSFLYQMGAAGSGCRVLTRSAAIGPK